MKRVFKLERNLMKVARPIVKRLTDIPLPEDSYFGDLQELFLRLDGVDRVLLDREITSIRLVTNAERMVIRETQRAFMYFCLYGLVVDAVVVNRLFPESLQDAYFTDWLATQQNSLEQIGAIFDPIPTYRVNMRKDEVVGLQRLSDMGRAIYGDTDPSKVLHEEKPYEIEQHNGELLLKIKLPFVTKEYVDLFKEAGDLVVRIGSFKRHVFLPRMLADRQPGRATLDNNVLAIRFPKSIEAGEKR